MSRAARRRRTRRARRFRKLAELLVMHSWSVLGRVVWGAHQVYGDSFAANLMRSAYAGELGRFIKRNRAMVGAAARAGKLGGMVRGPVLRWLVRQ